MQGFICPGFKSEESFEKACAELVLAIKEELTKKHAWAAVAESLTGGLISTEIVGVPGSSQWFKEGCVTYTEQAKMQRLGVKSDTLARFSAVSRQTAEQMALGMLSSSGADIAVAATGLAGPGPDEFGREPGLVYIGGAAKNGFVVKELHLSGDRLEIRRQAAYAALCLLAGLAKL